VLSIFTVLVKDYMAISIVLLLLSLFTVYITTIIQPYYHLWMNRLVRCRAAMSLM